MKSYEELKEKITLFIDEESKETFDELIIEVHAFQKNNCEILRKYTDLHCKSPNSWREIIPIPTEAFKNPEKLISFPEKNITQTFLTSGTTGTVQGKHHFFDTSIYEKSVLATWDKLNLPQLPLICLTQSPEVNKVSSLVHMFNTLGGKYLINSSGKININKINSFLTKINEPIILSGTALAFLYLLENSSQPEIKLPSGSWILETGGYKGKKTTITKESFYSKISKIFCIPKDNIINEYSMTELSSQFYSNGLNRTHKSAHWLKTRVVIPGQNDEVADGEKGLLAIYDLANLGSSVAIMTGDVAIKRGEDFELIGRDENLTPRGCSLAAEELISRHN
ncbi:MAG: hypothetical protein ACJ0IZ_08585 [Verrucomicrobiales bacterium]|nr:hypothetical protein [Verrucomicrobiales bacterium]